MKMKLVKAILATTFSLFASTAAIAQTGSEVSDPSCINAQVIGPKMITDICWTCIFPIRVAGVPISGGGGSFPDDAVRTPVCACDDNLGVPRPGITTSMWEPFRLIEFQRTPGCSSVLNGAKFPFDPIFRGNHSNGDRDHSDGSFMHYHYYAFPLMIMLDMFTGGECNAGGYVDLDLMYLSEVDPTWNNDELAFFTNPEAALVANPVAALACIPDAISSMAGKPIKELFWCAGSWGTVYPLSGNVNGGSGVLNDSSLMSVKALAALHRRGLAWGTVGKDAMCGGIIKPVLPKDQYKFTMLHPVPETSSAHALGQSVMFWGAGRTIPSVGEDPIYTIWRWKDCCNR